MNESRLEAITEAMIDRIYPSGNRPLKSMSDEKFVSRKYSDDQYAREEIIAKRIGNMLNHEVEC